MNAHFNVNDTPLGFRQASLNMSYNHSDPSILKGFKVKSKYPYQIKKLININRLAPIAASSRTMPVPSGLPRTRSDYAESSAVQRRQSPKVYHRAESLSFEVLSSKMTSKTRLFPIASECSSGAHSHDIMTKHHSILNHNKPCIIGESPKAVRSPKMRDKKRAIHRNCQASRFIPSIQFHCDEDEEDWINDKVEPLIDEIKAMVVQEKPAELIEYILAYCTARSQGLAPPRTDVMDDEDSPGMEEAKASTPHHRTNRISSLNSLIKIIPTS